MYRCSSIAVLDQELTEFSALLLRGKQERYLISNPVSVLPHRVIILDYPSQSNQSISPLFYIGEISIWLNPNCAFATRVGLDTFNPTGERTWLL